MHKRAVRRGRAGGRGGGGKFRQVFGNLLFLRHGCPAGGPQTVQSYALEHIHRVLPRGPHAQGKPFHGVDPCIHIGVHAPGQGFHLRAQAGNLMNGLRRFAVQPFLFGGELVKDLCIVLIEFDDFLRVRRQPGVKLRGFGLAHGVGSAAHDFRRRVKLLRVKECVELADGHGEGVPLFCHLGGFVFGDAERRQ